MTKQTKQAIVITIAILILCLTAAVAAFKHREIKWWYWWVKIKRADTQEEKDAILKQYEEEKAVYFLLKGLGAEDRDVDKRQKIAEALARVGTDAVPRLIKALKVDEEAYVRYGAAELLGMIGDVRAVPPLVEALGDRDYFVREDAAKALARFGIDAVGALADALEDEKEDTRYWAAYALGRAGERSARGPLRQAMKKERVEHVRREMELSVRKIEKLPDETVEGSG